MAACRERLTCIAIAVLLLAVYTKAEEAYLEILPNGETQTKAIGSSILLTCKPKVANTQLVENMQWRDPHGRVIDSLKKDGRSKPSMYTELHQDNSLSLFFNSLEEKQAGQYTCSGSYAHGIPMIKFVTIETIVAITWENAPQNQYPILGEDFAVQCKVRARPPPSIDWLYNGELIKTNDRYIIETHSLIIKNVQESDDGVYTCRASVPTTGELKERAIRVEVHIRPTIDEIPNPVKLVEGSPASINCTAKGKPQPTISWIKSLTQQNLSSTDGFRVDPVSGTLTIINVNREDAGEYQCIAENRANITKANIQVNVIVKPKIMEFENKTGVMDLKTEFKCKAFGRPSPNVTFRKFTREKPFIKGSQYQDRIDLTNNVDESTGETIGILTIHKILTSDDGLYECVAQNSGGVAYRNGHLTVEFPPSFAYMQNNTIWSWNGQKRNITCTANSIPNATIEWYRYKTELIKDSQDYGHYRIYGKGPESKLEVWPSDNRFYGTYKCVATNLHGQSEISLELQEAKIPSNLLQVKMKELTATTIKFDLIPPETRDIPVKIITVEYKERSQVWPQARNKTWIVGSVYAIEGLKPLMSYEYRFSTGNEVGNSGWGLNHYEVQPGKTAPNQPEFVKGTPDSEYEISPFSNQYELSWLPPADNGEAIDKYDIKCCQMMSDGHTVLDNTCTTIEIIGPRTREYLKNLRPDTFYKADLTAHNAIGYGRSGSLKFKTARGVDNTVVQNQAPLMSSGSIIGIVLATGFIIFIIIDIICCCVRKSGIINCVYERFRRKPVDEEDAKLGRDDKEPLKEEKKITPIIDSGLRRETSVTFDGKRSVSKTGFVGKDSAV